MNKSYFFKCFFAFSCWLFFSQGKLAALISAAEAAGVSFVYAISPGLDIVFSCAADVAALKRKMKQVFSLSLNVLELIDAMMGFKSMVKH